MTSAISLLRHEPVPTREFDVGENNRSLFGDLFDGEFQTKSIGFEEANDILNNVGNDMARWQSNVSTHWSDSFYQWTNDLINNPNESASTHDLARAAKYVGATALGGFEILNNISTLAIKSVHGIKSSNPIEMIGDIAVNSYLHPFSPTKALNDYFEMPSERQLQSSIANMLDVPTKWLTASKALDIFSNSGRETIPYSNRLSKDFKTSQNNWNLDFSENIKVTHMWDNDFSLSYTPLKAGDNSSYRISAYASNGTFKPKILSNEPLSSKISDYFGTPQSLLDAAIKKMDLTGSPINKIEVSVPLGSEPGQVIDHVLGIPNSPWGTTKALSPSDVASHSVVQQVAAHHGLTQITVGPRTVVPNIGTTASRVTFERPPAAQPLLQRLLDTVLPSQRR